MTMCLAERPARIASDEAIDPLVDDDPADRIVVTTERAISRVALVASEAGARFQRDAAGYDAMAWMLSPRRVFGGLRPLDACLGRDDCLRGLLVHGLGLGFDVERSAVDALIADYDGERGDRDDAPTEHDSLYARSPGAGSAGAWPVRARGARRTRQGRAALRP